MVKTYDVFCDEPGCGHWTHGTTANAKNSGGASNEARKAARAAGWTRRDGRDLCPRHR